MVVQHLIAQLFDVGIPELCMNGCLTIFLYTSMLASLLMYFDDMVKDSG